ncbi:sun-cor steroid hormone receptor co-repressor [Anaeramoeba flamelloides]|uniref:Nuclear nucleic acid-binding protein C1D n=1 Tax=Anaeramoeba flamelloides TaxID=1746091 RepID=A0AAV8A6H2_9EUKA|nr:sun-cor steroid hormone receptor co-repressor [Anaeramoeba flamelloides]KAJ6229843.1 sun-cor steroid hormone receptor co-repressor [Anaeramoeba flamelloides]
MTQDLESLPKELLENLNNFDQSLTKCEKTLEQMLTNSLPEITENLEPLEQAKLNMSIAYTINSLYFMYLKTQGIDPKKHPVKKELERVKLYIKKIKDITELQKSGLSSQNSSSQSISKEQKGNKKGTNEKKKKKKKKN